MSGASAANAQEPTRDRLLEFARNTFATTTPSAAEAGGRLPVKTNRFWPAAASVRVSAERSQREKVFACGRRKSEREREKD